MGDTWFKRTSAAQFYKLIRWLSGIEIPENVGDFRLLDRQAVDVLREMPEQHRFVRGLVTWVDSTRLGWNSSASRGLPERQSTR